MHLNTKSIKIPIDNIHTHESNLQIVCPVCHKEFGTPKQFAGHKKSCSLYLEKNIEILDPEEPMVTENYTLTGRVCKVQQKLKRQKRGRPSLGDCGPPYICDICGKSFPLKGHIYNHMTRSHFKPPMKKQTCNLCSATVVDMKAHSVVHSLKRPFTCEYCNASFKKSSHLTDHRLIHTGEKPHVCPVCSKAFVQVGDMYKHAKRSHNSLVPRKKSSSMKESMILENLISEETISSVSMSIQEEIYSIEPEYLFTEESISLNIEEVDLANVESPILDVDNVVEQTAFIIQSDKEDNYGVAFLQ